ncbi:toxin secretion/phage lysis holin [Natranaerovirga pectinivora]|uniref:Toxin secretion/phage lysis holin n=1 Tax=Natranaerovirga pectinivora TaxID=682400 RepID=A0A4R3MLK8_9FIRM|nr:phage holin family protein [Natranaerovirga pectinivora]TCT14567.1 toxin secretion/phage lysis holin [Natranaerovirga pectinivora]
MKEIINTLQFIFTVLGASIGWFLGGVDGLVYALITFVVIDYITGVMVAILEKKVSSEIGFRGICKKVLIFIFVGVGFIIDSQIIKDGSAIRTAVIFFYLSNEGISILENATKVGLPVPKKLKVVFQELKKEDE